MIVKGPAVPDPKRNETWITYIFKEDIYAKNRDCDSYCGPFCGNGLW